MCKFVQTMIVMLMISALVAVAPAGATTVKYAGTVRAMDAATGSLILDDVGPWTSMTESPITARTIQVSSATQYVVADRVGDGATRTGFPGDYVERSGQPSDVAIGAFVSVECERDGAGCTAVKLTVVRPGQS